MSDLNTSILNEDGSMPQTVQAKFDREFSKWCDDMEKQIESTRQSEMLSADDFAITINARDDNFGS